VEPVRSEVLMAITMTSVELPAGQHKTEIIYFMYNRTQNYLDDDVIMPVDCVKDLRVTRISDSKSKFQTYIDHVQCQASEMLGTIHYRLLHTMAVLSTLARSSTYCFNWVKA
jgi:hypothetical protein